MDPKIKEARRKHRLKQHLRTWPALLAILALLILSHRVQWQMAKDAGLTSIEAFLVILLAWLCVIGFGVIPIWRRLNR